jgi:hypothetical protein
VREESEDHAPPPCRRLPRRRTRACPSPRTPPLRIPAQPQPPLRSSSTRHSPLCVARATGKGKACERAYVCERACARMRACLCVCVRASFAVERLRECAWVYGCLCLKWDSVHECMCTCVSRKANRRGAHDRAAPSKGDGPSEQGHCTAFMLHAALVRRGPPCASPRGRAPARLCRRSPRRRTRACPWTRTPPLRRSAHTSPPQC